MISVKYQESVYKYSLRYMLIHALGFGTVYVIVVEIYKFSVQNIYYSIHGLHLEMLQNLLFFLKKKDPNNSRSIFFSVYQSDAKDNAFVVQDNLGYVIQLISVKTSIRLSSLEFDSLIISMIKVFHFQMIGLHILYELCLVPVIFV